jgi:hypothetical protein
MLYRHGHVVRCLSKAVIAIAVTVLASAAALCGTTGANVFAVQPPCVGDCYGGGQVTVDEILTMVNIALGNLDIASCINGHANGDGQITIDEILSAVNNAVNGCVSGSWREDQFSLASSTCPAQVNAEIQNQLAQELPCVYTVSQNASNVHIVDCKGATADANVDATGTIQLDFPPLSVSQQGCTVVQTVQLVIPAEHSPTTASYSFHFELSGACSFSRCDLTVQSRWTKL